MLNFAKNFKNHNLVNLKTKIVFIDNLIFWCHYRLTVIVLLTGVALLSSQEYLGEHIKSFTSVIKIIGAAAIVLRCLFPNKDLIKFIDRYCFFMSTFTVVKHQNKSVFHREVAHAGVGPFVFDSGWQEDEIQRHTYYQWVVFVLFLQSLAFYFPHLLWRLSEKGKLKFLVQSIKTNDMLNSNKKIKSFVMIEMQLKNRIYTYQTWAWTLIFCEFLNLLNLIFQVYITELFLNRQFLSLGPKVYWDRRDDEYNPLDIVFPKVSKCTFLKFGPSGSVQHYDVLCILALNIVNEKLFIFLWFWYIILGILSVWILLWRLLCFFLRKLDRFNLYYFKAVATSKFDDESFITVMRNISYGEWIFLNYLTGSMGGRLFTDFIEKLALSYKKPLPLLPMKNFEKVKTVEKPFQTFDSTEKPLIDFLDGEKTS